MEHALYDRSTNMGQQNAKRTACCISHMPNLTNETYKALKRISLFVWIESTTDKIND